MSDVPSLLRHSEIPLQIKNNFHKVILHDGTEIEALCTQMSKDRFKRLLEGLQGMQKEWMDPELDISNQNKTNMASFSEVVSNTNTNTNQNNTVGADNVTGESSDPSDNIKHTFLKDTDVNGSLKPPRSLWLTNVEIYKAIDTKIQAEQIKGEPEFENRSTNSNGYVKPCYKCLQVGRFVYDSPNDWVLTTCKLMGHKMMGCPNAFQEENNNEEQTVTTNGSVNDSQSTELAEKPKSK
ncbi:unnamed protein product [Mytilus coruscus]|uniref:Uncharacterized protein n=1 Tax=Mytilus coruscus TaxID=42192 RepID=A0A6J8BB58_MYTCO|nr:unnamed protein product [Mytilus coruscus]